MPAPGGGIVAAVSTPSGPLSGPARTGPDEVDLRLVSAVANLGRSSVADAARYAGLSVEDALTRLSRLQRRGIPLVLGVEGDQRSLRAWVSARRQRPERGSAPGAQPAPPPTTLSARAAAHRRPGLGDRVDIDGPTGPVALTLVDVVDTADALYAAGGHTLAPGARAAVVHTEVTTGSGGYPTVPDTLLTLVLADGSEVSKSGATLSSRPPFRGPLGPQDTVGGHTLYELDAAADIVAVRWRPVPGARPVQWQV